MIYYNENDKHAAAWLRELMFEGQIPWGDVDERSIEDVRPIELAGYTQCHFFAGIGGWAYALRLAGWPDNRRVWTGSCPCQPFSAAGKGNGFADERHLWPAWFHLIEECEPPVVFGEQVASKDGLGWLDLVHADLEGAGYAVGASDLCAAGVGAPHIRQRLYWVADLDGERLEVGCQPDRDPVGSQQQTSRRADTGGRRKIVLAHAAGERLEVLSVEQTRGQCQAVERGGEACVVGNPELSAEERLRSNGREVVPQQEAEGPRLSGAWGRVEWVFCRDGKSRPVEPGTFPMAHGVPGRVGLLRGYGNAIVPEVAAVYIGAYLDV